MKKLKSLTLSACLAAFGCLAADEPVVYDFTDVCASYLTKQSAVIWKNRRLSEITAITACLKGGWISSALKGKSVIYDRTETSFTAQLQAVDGHCKAVRAFFSQVGDDIVASADKAGYGNGALYGTRLPDSLFSQAISTDGANGTYGAYGLEAFGDVRLSVGELPSSAAGVVVNGGLLQVEVGTNQTVSAAVSGTGGLKFLSEAGKTEPHDCTLDGFATQSDRLALAGGLIETLVVTGGTIRGGWCGGPFAVPAYNAVYDASAGTYSVQFQYYNSNNGSLKGVAVVFTQKDDGIYVKAVKAAQASETSWAASKQALGSDMFGENWPASGTYIATSDDGYGYGVKDIAFTCDSLVSATLSGEKAWTGGTVVDGANVIVSSNRLAANTEVRIVRGGCLALTAASSVELANGNSYYVGTNSMLRDKASFAVNYGDAIVLDGGSADFRHNNLYVNNLTLMNGGFVTGDVVQIGLNGSASWKTLGETPVEVRAPVRMVGAARTFDLNVTADIVFCAALYEHVDYLKMKFAKSGSGKATFRKSFTTGGAVTLSGGALEFDADSSFGSLALAADAALAVADGCSVSFADSSSAAWTGDALLQVSGSVRFGTSADGLTRSQLRRIRLNGQRVILDENGWLVAGTPGLIITVR